MEESHISHEERIRSLDIIKNKKLVKILNHKMFKGYRDIKASKWFFNHKPKYISPSAWEDKIFDPFDDLYNLNYKMNVLKPLKTPNFDNILSIKHYPINLYDNEKATLTYEVNDIKRPKTSFNSFSSSSKNVTTFGIRNKKKIKKKEKTYDKKNNFYLTSMGVHYTDNYHHEYNPEKVIKEIFRNDKVIYNDIPILSLDKVDNINKKINNKNNYIRNDSKLKKNKSKNKKNQERIYVKSTENEIIQTDNIHDDVYNGLTERQFLYKISHNNKNKNIDEKININSFRKNKGFVKGFVNKRLRTARPSKNVPTLDKKVYGPKGVTIELEFDETGRMKTKKMFTTKGTRINEEIISGNNNNFLIYNTNSIDTSKSKNQSKAKSESHFESESEDAIFGNPFKNLKKNIKHPPLKVFQNKPRFFDDKIMLQLQLEKKNQFSKLKQLILKK